MPKFPLPHLLPVPPYSPTPSSPPIHSSSCSGKAMDHISLSPSKHAVPWSMLFFTRSVGSGETFAFTPVSNTFYCVTWDKLFNFSVLVFSPRKWGGPWYLPQIFKVPIHETIPLTQLMHKVRVYEEDWESILLLLGEWQNHTYWSKLKIKSVYQWSLCA